MEPRIARLEAQMGAVDGRLTKVEGKLDQVDSRLRAVETAVATLTERVAHLPSKGFIVTAVSVPAGLIAALILFVDRLRALIAG